jgi:hypothetical protein
MVCQSRLYGAAGSEKALEKSNWYVQLNNFTKPLDWPFLDLHLGTSNHVFREAARCTGERQTWSTGTLIGLPVRASLIYQHLEYGDSFEPNSNE